MKQVSYLGVVYFVVLRARVIPECLDNPTINSLREVTSCQNGLSD